MTDFQFSGEELGDFWLPFSLLPMLGFINSSQKIGHSWPEAKQLHWADTKYRMDQFVHLEDVQMSIHSLLDSQVPRTSKTYAQVCTL